MNKNANLALAVVVVLALAAGQASAAGTGVDVTAAISGIAEAGVAILSVIAALLAMSVSIFGLAKAYGFIKRKAGA